MTLKNMLFERSATIVHSLWLFLMKHKNRENLVNFDRKQNSGDLWWSWKECALTKEHLDMSGGYRKVHVYVYPLVHFVVTLHTLHRAYVYLIVLNEWTN